MWGTGTPRREFLHVDDLADACLFLMDHYEGAQHINVGTGVDLSIRELAETVRDVVYPEAELVFDTTKPDGTPAQAARRRSHQRTRLDARRSACARASSRPTRGSWSTRPSPQVSVGDDDAALVSVVTPCLNAREWLPRCIASVAAQGLDRVEHIVVDGGSLDGTVELLRDSPHIRWWSEPDRGQSDAINKGIRQARGTLITWLNADDVLEPGAVDRVVAAWRTNPDAAVFYGDCAIVEGDRRTLWTPPPRIRTQDFDNRGPLPQVGTFVTANALNEVGGVDDQLHLAMDFDLFLRLSLAGHQFVYTGATLATFVLHANSKSGANIHGEFLREEARSLLAAGRTEPATVALGRAGALAASLPHRQWESAYWKTVGTSPLAEQAGAHLEATRVFVQSGSIARALPHSLHPSVWRSATTRRALVSSARRFPQRAVHRWKARA